LIVFQRNLGRVIGKQLLGVARIYRILIYVWAIVSDFLAAFLLIKPCAGASSVEHYVDFLWWVAQEDTAKELLVHDILQLNAGFEHKTLRQPVGDISADVGVNASHCILNQLSNETTLVPLNYRNLNLALNLSCKYCKHKHCDTGQGG